MEHPSENPLECPLDRRKFLETAAGVVGASLTSGLGISGCSNETKNIKPRKLKGTKPKSTSTTKPNQLTEEQQFTTLPDGVTVPSASWVSTENAKPGSLGWIVETPHLQPPHNISGFSNKISAQVGETVTLYVNTVAKSFHVDAYRMGYYQGLGGRLIWRSPEMAGQIQPPPTFTRGINMVECHWAPSLSFQIKSDWPEGDYLLKLIGSGGEQRHIPLCIRNDTSKAAFVIQNCVTTWQAYNRWGGYSLYLGATPGGGASFANRSRIVSFDRPYTYSWAQGAADFVGNEFPVVFLAEKLGLDVTYWTDVDLALRPELLKNHRCLFSLGHDEYWSQSMRQGAINARDAGVNLAFLGANACYRHIRFESSPLGPYRRVVCYKVASEDPLYRVDNARVTANWPAGPDPRPESTLIGDMYQSYGAKAPLVVVDASSWVFRGTGLKNGQALPNVVGSEFDAYVPSLPGPKNIQILSHSPVVALGKHSFSDATYYSVPIPVTTANATAGPTFTGPPFTNSPTSMGTTTGGGGVFASGTAWWISKLGAGSIIPNLILPGPVPGVTEYLLRVMENIFSVFGAGPAGITHPSIPNWQIFYPGGKGITPQNYSPGSL